MPTAWSRPASRRASTISISPTRADFVFGVAQFDAAARAAGVFVLSGVSSFPGADRRGAARNGADDGYGLGRRRHRAVALRRHRPQRDARGRRLCRRAGEAAARRPAGDGTGWPKACASPSRCRAGCRCATCASRWSTCPTCRSCRPSIRGLSDIWMGAGPVPEVLHRILNVLAKARARLRPAVARAALRPVLPGAQPDAVRRASRRHVRARARPARRARGRAQLAPARRRRRRARTSPRWRSRRSCAKAWPGNGRRGRAPGDSGARTGRLRRDFRRALDPYRLPRRRGPDGGAVSAACSARRSTRCRRRCANCTERPPRERGAAMPKCGAGAG